MKTKFNLALILSLAGVLSLLNGAKAATPGFADDFAAGLNATAWQVISNTSGYTVDTSQGDVRFSRPAGGTNTFQYVGLELRPRLRGDFDVSVDFTNASITRVDGTPGNQVQLNLFLGGFGGQGFLVVRSDESFAGQNAHVWVTPPGAAAGTIPMTNSAGRLRVTRTGIHARAYINDTLLYEGDYNSNDAIVQFTLQNNGTRDATAVTFDNFSLLAGAVLWPVHDFAETFDGTMLDPALEDPGNSYQFSNGLAWNTGGRNYLRTVATDFNTMDFVAEVTYVMNGGNWGSGFFFGLGAADLDSSYFNEPLHSVYVCEHTQEEGCQCAETRSLSSPGNPTGFFSWTDPGITGSETNVLRLLKQGGQLTFQMDWHDDSQAGFKTNYSGSISLADLPFLDASNSRLFVGTASGSTRICAFSVYPIPSGDLNDNGSLDLEDAALALQFAVGLATPTVAQLQVGDTSGDGVMDVADAVRILRAVQGLEALPGTPMETLPGPMPRVSLQIGAAVALSNNLVAVPIQLVCPSNTPLLGVSFTLVWNQSQLTFHYAVGATLPGPMPMPPEFNTNRAAAGLLGYAVAAPGPGGLLPAGTNLLFTVCFRATSLPVNTSACVWFSDDLALRQIVGLDNGQAVLLTPGADWANYLPVYLITQSGATSLQASNLALALSIPPDRLDQTNGLVSFIDPTNWLFVPTTPMTNATVMSNLLAVTKNLSTNPIVFECIDFEALSRLSPPGPETALPMATNALGFAGLTPQFGTPAISCSLLTAFYTNADGTVTSAHQYLDTQVEYRFADANGVPLIGPGAQVQLTFGANSNVSRLRYAASQLGPGPSVAIISPSEAANRAAGRLSAGASLSSQLVYWEPDPEWPSQFWLLTHPHGPPPPPSPSPLTVLPYYVVEATTTETNPVSGSNYMVSLGTTTIPATDDTNFVPLVSFSASVPGQTQVVATASVTGGTPPYLYLWSGSDPEITTNTAASIVYTPRVRMAPPGLGIARSAAGDSVTASWPYPSDGFVLQHTPDLAAATWTDAPGPYQYDTNTGLNAVSLPLSNRMFFRLRLASQTLPTTETVGVTVIDANGVMVGTNQTLGVLAMPYPLIAPDPPSWGVEAPFASFSADHNKDLSEWNSGMSGSVNQFFWYGLNSWPGDFMEPKPPGTGQFIPAQDAGGHNVGSKWSFYADADVIGYEASRGFRGVNTANLVMYIGDGNTAKFSFTWPENCAAPPSYVYYRNVELIAPGEATSARYRYCDCFESFDYIWPMDLAGAWGNQMSPMACLDWLVFYCDNLLQYKDSDVNDCFPPNSLYWKRYAWKRWGGAFNGLHMMLGFHSGCRHGVGTTQAFAKNLKCYYPAGSPGPGLQLSLPATIVQAWFDACHKTQDNGETSFFHEPAAMGPIYGSPFIVAGAEPGWDFRDHWITGMFGGQGPDIPPQSIKGWWYLRNAYGNPRIVPNGSALHRSPAGIGQMSHSVE